MVLQFVQEHRHVEVPGIGGGEAIEYDLSASGVYDGGQG